MDTAQGFPPLAPLDVMPVHSGRVDFTRDGWFGCEHPERPADSDVMWDWRCRSCVLHAKATLINQGDDEIIWFATPGGEPEWHAPSWFVARAEVHGVIRP